MIDLALLLFNFEPPKGQESALNVKAAKFLWDLRRVPPARNEEDEEWEKLREGWGRRVRVVAVETIASQTKCLMNCL